MVVQGLLYAFGRALHYYPSTDAFSRRLSHRLDRQFMVRPGSGRHSRSGQVLLTFLVGRRFLSAPGGLIGALTARRLAGAHSILTLRTNDVPMAFFALLTYVFLWDVYRRGRGRDYILSGIGVGLARRPVPAGTSC